MVRLYEELFENGVSLEIDTTKFNTPSISFIFKKKDVAYTYSYSMRGLEEMGEQLIEKILLMHLSDFLRYYTKEVSMEDSYG